MDQWTIITIFVGIPIGIVVLWSLIDTLIKAYQEDKRDQEANAN
jgi:uncharacterized membrane protein